MTLTDYLNKLEERSLSEKDKDILIEMVRMLAEGCKYYDTIFDSHPERPSRAKQALSKCQEILESKANCEAMLSSKEDK